MKLHYNKSQIGILLVLHEYFSDRKLVTTYLKYMTKHIFKELVVTEILEIVV